MTMKLSVATYVLGQLYTMTHLVNRADLARLARGVTPVVLQAYGCSFRACARHLNAVSAADAVAACFYHDNHAVSSERGFPY